MGSGVRFASFVSFVEPEVERTTIQQLEVRIQTTKRILANLVQNKAFSE